MMKTTPPPRGRMRLKKGKAARRVTAIATVFRIAKNNPYLTGICIFMVMAPFIHIPVMYSDYNKTPFLGYKFLASFFYDFGWDITILCAGLLFKYCIRYAIEEGKAIFKFISHILLILGTYFLIYALIPMPSSKDLPVWLYLTILGVVATILGIMIYQLQDHIERLARKELLGPAALEELQRRLKQQLKEEKEQQQKEINKLNRLNSLFKSSEM